MNKEEKEIEATAAPTIQNRVDAVVQMVADLDVEKWAYNMAFELSGLYGFVMTIGPAKKEPGKIRITVGDPNTDPAFAFVSPAYDYQERRPAAWWIINQCTELIRLRRKYEETAAQVEEANDQ